MNLEAWIALGFGLLGIIGTVIGAVAKLSVQLGKVTTRFELIGTQQATEISRMNVAIEKVEVAMTSIAVDRERTSNIEKRVVLLEQWYDELRRAIGRIT